MNEDLHSLGSEGLDPAPTFVARLESDLGRAFDGAVPATGAAAIGRRQRVLVGAAAGAVAAAAVIAVVALSGDDGNRSIGDAPFPTATESLPTTVSPSGPVVATSITLAPATSEASPSTSMAPTSTSAGASTSTIGETTTTAIAATSTTTSPAPTTTIASPPPPAPTTVIDLTRAAPALSPTVIASYPSAPPGDLFPTAFAAPMLGGRIAVFDNVAGAIRFIDGSTGAELATYPTELPTIGSERFVGYMLIGPDDIIYTIESTGSAADAAAYAVHEGAYVEVARSPVVLGDAGVYLGPTGVTYGVEVLMPYVDADGEPSGAILEIPNLPQFESTLSGLVRSVSSDGRFWTLQYVVSGDSRLGSYYDCDVCQQFDIAPDGNVLLTDEYAGDGGDRVARYTVLADDVESFDSSGWRFVGFVGSSFVFSRLDQDSIDIGTYTP